MKQEIEKLKKQLPAKGYSKLIQAEAKKTLKTKITEDQIWNFFSGSDTRKVSEAAQDVIIDATKNVIKNIKQKAEDRRKRAALS